MAEKTDAKSEEMLQALKDNAPGLKPSTERKNEFNALKHIAFEAPVTLSQKREIQVMTGAPLKACEWKHLGKQFNNDVYYCMSQGMLDARMLELIANEEKVGEIVIAPSFLIKELWDAPTKSDNGTYNFNHFYSLSLDNLSEVADGKRQVTHSKWNITEENLEAENER